MRARPCTAPPSTSSLNTTHVTHTHTQTVARPPALPTHKRGLSSMTDLGTGPLALAEFVELLPAVLERCNTKQMRKCEPVKHLLE